MHFAIRKNVFSLLLFLGQSLGFAFQRWFVEHEKVLLQHFKSLKMENNWERSAKVFGHRQAFSDGPVYPTLYGKFQLQTQNFLWLLVKMHSLLWNMPHSWYAHMMILQCHSHLLGGKLKPKFYAKILHQCKVSSLCGAEPTKHTIEKVGSKCAYWIWSKHMFPQECQFCLYWQTLKSR